MDDQALTKIKEEREKEEAKKETPKESEET